MTTQTDSPRFFRGSSVGTPVRGVYFFFVVRSSPPGGASRPPPARGCHKHPDWESLQGGHGIYSCVLHTVQYSTVQYSTVQYSTVQYSTVQYSTVQYSTVQYSTVQYSTVQYSTVQYSTVQYSTVQYSTVQYSTVQYSTVQYSTVQYSTVQYSTVQYSTVQYSTVQYSTVQYSTVQYSTVQYSTVHTTYGRFIVFQGIFSSPLFFRAKMPFLARFNQYKPVVTSLSQSCGHFPLVTETENNKKKSIPPSSSPRFLRGSPVGSPYPLNHTSICFFFFFHFST